jgi:hypothetical protein
LGRTSCPHSASVCAGARVAVLTRAEALLLEALRKASTLVSGKESVLALTWIEWSRECVAVLDDVEAQVRG